MLPSWPTGTMGLRSNVPALFRDTMATPTRSAPPIFSVRLIAMSSVLEGPENLPAAIDSGMPPRIATYAAAVVKVPVPVPNNIVSDELPLLATATSSLPSPLKSPVMMATGSGPTANTASPVAGGP